MAYNENWEGEDYIYGNLDFSKFSNLSGVVEIDSDVYPEYSSDMGITPSEFLTINRKSYFAKYPTLRSGDAGYEILVELFVAFLAKKVGINCIDAKLLINHDRVAVGVISPDFGEHFTYAELCGITKRDDNIISAVRIVETVAQSGKNNFYARVNNDELLEELNKIACFDYLTKQDDRHGNNFAFLLVENGTVKEFKLAPLYDNANAFLSRTCNNTNLTPNNSEVRCVEEQKLLNTKYKDMLTKFERMFSNIGFIGLIKEFNSIYGLDNVFETEEYQSLLTEIKTAVQKRIELCKNRQIKETYIPLEATYLVMQKHRNEWTKDEDLRFQLQSDLEEYYGNDDKRDSYENFYNETKGVFGKWHWYEECLSLAKAMDSGQLNKARKEMFARKREFDRRILNIFIEDMEEGYISEYSQRNFILFGDKKFGKLLHKKTMQQMTFFANEKISRNYKYFKELRDWCYEVETSGKAITAKEQAELEETKKLLTKYIKHANIFTNLNMSDYDIQELPQKSVELNSDGNADENNALQ